MKEELRVPNIIDRAEAALAELPQEVVPVIHRFAPGIYSRECHVRAGTLFVSMEHRTDHFFVLSKGRLRIHSDTEGDVIYEAPLTGITKAGTRRIVFAHTDIVFTTFHVTDETDIEKIGESILAPNSNPLLPDGHENIEQWKKSNPKHLTDTDQ